MIVFAIVSSLVLGCFYLVLAGQAGGSELVVGAVVTVACAAFACVAHARRRRLYAFPKEWPLVALRAASGIVPDLGRVGWVLLRAVWRRPPGAVGRLSVLPFATEPPEARDAARRAVAALAVSLAPNGFVIRRADRAEGLLVHHLVPVRAKGSRTWPV